MEYIIKKGHPPEKRNGKLYTVRREQVPTVCGVCGFSDFIKNKTR